MATEKSYGQGLLSHTPRVSINPLIEFMSASDRRKLSIVKNQKTPSTIRVAPYSIARAAIRNFVKEDFDYHRLIAAIEKLQKRDQSTQWRRQDTSNSINALRHFMDMNFPTQLSRIKCTFAKSVIKDCYMNDVLITISPDLIMKWEIDGIKYVGAVKFRLSQKPIDYSSGRNAAALLAHYLETSIAQSDEVVDNKHCLFVDVFAENVIPAPQDKSQYIEEISKACDEYSKLWRAA